MRWLSIVLLLFACNGNIGDSEPGPRVPPPLRSAVPGGDPPATACALPDEGAPIPLRRLTAFQLASTVQDVLGVSAVYSTADETLTGFRANTSTSVQDEGASDFFLSANATAAVAAVPIAAACAEAGTCQDTALALGARLFRRPLRDETRDRYLAVYAAGLERGGPVEALRWFLEAVLQSPRFLYQVEETDESGYLDDYAMAARLSLAIWGRNPDRALLDDARDGLLSTQEGVRVAAERLIDDPQFEEGAHDFIAQWLRLESLEDESKRADFFELDEEVRTSLIAEPAASFVQHVREGDGVIGLLEDPTTVADPALDAFYGTESLDVVGEHRSLDPARRAGLLTLPGVQAALSHAEASAPTVRGFTILARFLCAPPPPPPAGVTPSLPPSDGELTTRERLSIHFDSDTCGGCHRSMDGIGFTFENYDWLGRWRDEEHGVGIDASSDFELDGHQIVADGPVEMSRELAGRWDVDVCVARQWLVFASGISETSTATCLMEEMALTSRRTGLRDMILTMLTSEWFRRPYAGDGT